MNLQFGQDAVGWPIFVLCCFIWGGSVGSWRICFHVVSLACLASWFCCQMKDQPWEWASDFKSSSHDLSMGNLGFLTTWWPSANPTNPMEQGGIFPISLLKSHWLSKQSQSLLNFKVGDKPYNSTEGKINSDYKKNGWDRIYCCSNLWKIPLTTLTNHSKLRNKIYIISKN